MNEVTTPKASSSTSKGLGKMQKYSDEELLEELRRVHRLVGDVSRDTFNEVGNINSGTVINRFGSWNEGKEAAGIPITPQNYVENGITGKEYYNKVLSDAECIECGEGRDACVQFHHVEEKEKNISTMISGDGRTASSTIYDEIKKTVPLCANCHERHHSPRSEFRIEDGTEYDWREPEYYA